MDESSLYKLNFLKPKTKNEIVNKWGLNIYEM